MKWFVTLFLFALACFQSAATVELPPYGKATHQVGSFQSSHNSPFDTNPFALFDLACLLDEEDDDNANHWQPVKTKSICLTYTTPRAEKGFSVVSKHHTSKQLQFYNTSVQRHIMLCVITC